MLCFCALAPGRASEARLPTRVEATAILQAICPGQIRAETLKNGTACGCGACPSFTGFAGQAPANSKEPDFELRQVLEGSFTRRGADELVAEFFGCEAHVANFGGTLLMEKAGEKWRRVHYSPGVIGMMRSYARQDGRDLVLLQAGYTGQGTTTAWISSALFSPKADPVERVLMRVEDTSGNGCESEQISIGYFDNIEFPDLNADGRPDLRVSVRWGKEKVPASVQGHCDQEFKPRQARVYKIDFVFDGNAFHVAPGSAAALRKVSARDE